MPLTSSPADIQLRTHLPLASCFSEASIVSSGLVSGFRIGSFQEHSSCSGRIRHCVSDIGSSFCFRRWPSLKASLSDGSTMQISIDERDERVVTGSKVKKFNSIEKVLRRMQEFGLQRHDIHHEEEHEDMDRAKSIPITGDEELEVLLQRHWTRPDKIGNENQEDETLLPWERKERGKSVLEDMAWKRKNVTMEGEKHNVHLIRGRKKSASHAQNVLEGQKNVRAPTLADLTIEDRVLTRLKKEGASICDAIRVPEAGLTDEVLAEIHKRWRKKELVKLRFDEVFSCQMETAHELVERCTGGLVTWRSGCRMDVFRGINYEGPFKHCGEGNITYVPNVPPVGETIASKDDTRTLRIRSLGVGEKNAEKEEDAEYIRLLDGLGPYFTGWWGAGIPPVDADLLPQVIPGYKPPLRFIPIGVPCELNYAELTNLGKLSMSLPPHFALGRNGNHQGLAAAIMKLWEKSLVAKIVIKPGVQSTNNRLMAMQLKKLTGGTLIITSKCHIVIYRGKDFIPANVAIALTEREALIKRVQDEEESMSRKSRDILSCNGECQVRAGTLAEFLQVEAHWRREMSAEEVEKVMKDASLDKTVKQLKLLQHKLHMAYCKKLRQVDLIRRMDKFMLPIAPPSDQEAITHEERALYRRLGMRMSSYVPMGYRGVFDGIIENMHLHWKYREVVRLICRRKDPTFVERSAKVLEYESGGILVSIENIAGGHALIYYRGKNYRPPVTIRPRNLLQRVKAFRRHMAVTRYKDFEVLIFRLQKAIEQIRSELECPTVEKQTRELVKSDATQS